MNQRRRDWRGRVIIKLKTRDERDESEDEEL
jgi:hypothetical protein